MTKTLFTLILCTIISRAAYSKTDTAFYYIKIVSEFCDQNHFQAEIPVDKKTDANFIRLVISPNIADSGLYSVNDYYLNGKVKFKGKSKSPDCNLILEGPCIELFDNGHRKRICTFHNGALIGDIIQYFPNGHVNTIKTIVQHQDSSKAINSEPKVAFKQCLDSVGKVLTMDGNGEWVEYQNNYKIPFAKGAVINGLPDGEWHGQLNDTAKYICNYINGELKSGKSYSSSGKEYPFSKIVVSPQFKGGLDSFGAYLGRTIRYPIDARERKIEGRVLVQFIVEKNGSLSDIIVVKSVCRSIDDEALNTIAHSPTWEPCYIYGINSTSIYQVPISFTIGK